MNELVVCLALLPFLFLALDLPDHVKIAVPWLAAVIGSLQIGYLVYSEPGGVLFWGSLASLGALLISEFLEKKRLDGDFVLASVFLGQALIAQSAETIIICLAFSDALINFGLFSRSKGAKKSLAIQNEYRALFSLLPAATAVVLDIGTSWRAVAFLITILLRLFSWPLPPWSTEDGQNPRRNILLVGAVSTMALWKSLDPTAIPEFTVVWLVVSSIFCLGSKPLEVFFGLCLALSIASPWLGLVTTAIWPILLTDSLSGFVMPIFLTGAGMLVCEFSNKIIVENGVYVLAFLSSLFFGRTLVSLTTQRRIWYKDAVDFVLAGLLVALFIWQGNPIQVQIGPSGIIFAGGFLFSFGLGKILSAKGKKWFEPVRGLKKIPEVNFTFLSRVLEEGGGPPVNIVEKDWEAKFFKILEGESAQILLLGALGLALIWGTR